MSTIRSFSLYTHCNDLGGKVWNPAIRWTKKYAVFVVLESDQGVQGLGECWCFDAAPDSLIAYLRTEVAPHILGCALVDYPALYKNLVTSATLSARHGMLASALSGVDVAIWDMQSRIAERPLWSFLESSVGEGNHSSKGQVQLYGSGGLYGQDKSIDDLTSEMRKMHQSGFAIVKMKVGALELADDIERVSAVLDSLGDSCKLIVDGVYSYSAEEAWRLYSALPDSRIEAFQSPVRASDIAGMQTLCQSGVPVMGTEAEYREEIHQLLIERGAIKFLQTAPVACGGFTRLNEIVATLGSSNHQRIKLSLEVSSTAVALAAACHFAASNLTVVHTEYHHVHQVFIDEFNPQAVPGRRGWFQLSDSPGLGITLPMSSVKKELELFA
ncbi:MAG: enolase C-terminal domain-like protein [Granulosicoccus sp.]